MGNVETLEDEINKLGVISDNWTQLRMILKAILGLILSDKKGKK